MFENNDTHEKAREGSSYAGKERRKQEPRRKITDRRENIRFDVNAEDRRENPGRRTSDHDPWFRHNE